MSVNSRIFRWILLSYCGCTLPIDAIVWQSAFHKRWQPRQIPAFAKHHSNILDATEIVLFGFLMCQTTAQHISDMIEEQQSSEKSTNRIDHIDEQVILSGRCVHNEHGQRKNDFQKCPRIAKEFGMHRPNEEMIE